MLSCYFTKPNGLNSAQKNLKQSFTEDMLITFLFYSNRLNTCQPNMSFSFEQEKKGKLSFLDVEVSREKGKFVTSVCRKSTFSGVHIHFESQCKFGVVCTLTYRYFKICSEWTRFHEELSFLKQVFLKSGPFVIY